MFLEFLILIALWIIPVVLSIKAIRTAPVSRRQFAELKAGMDLLMAGSGKQLPSISLVHSCGGIWGPWEVVKPFDKYQKISQQRQCSDCHYTEMVEL